MAITHKAATIIVDTNPDTVPSGSTYDDVFTTALEAAFPAASGWAIRTSHMLGSSGSNKKERWLIIADLQS